MLYTNLRLEPDALPALENELYEGHPKRYRKARLTSIAILFIILLAGPIILFFSPAPIWIAISATAFWVLLLLLSIFLEYRSFALRGYLLRENDLSYKKGLVFRNSLTIPFNRIQHSEISQSPSGRLFKLSTLKVYTAGGSGSDLSIHGLDPEEAERIRAFIMSKAEQHV